MFRRLSSSLPKDPEFPADLEKLGYFVTEKDQIKLISDPSKDFIFRISKNERVNEMQKEAMNTCIRNLVLSRLYNLGLQTIRLPFTASQTQPHIPILATPELSTKRRVIVVFGDPAQDLGIWAYRKIGQGSINSGSVIDFVKAVLDGAAGFTTSNDVGHGVEKEAPGIIIANTGQLIWYRGGSQAMTLMTWHAIPRKTAVHPPLKLDSVKNFVPGNETWEKHVEYVFDNVLDKMLAKYVEIDIIGVAEGGVGAVRYLAKNWPAWRTRISAMLLVDPQHTIDDLHPPNSTFPSTSGNASPPNTTDPSSFPSFVSKCTRAYLLSPSTTSYSGDTSSARPIETPFTGRDIYGCNCYASGETLNAECIVPETWPFMVRWLKLVHAVNGFEEVEGAVEGMDEVGADEERK